jgi:magnesium-protoporphyrin O-methyltransferase
MTDTSYTQRRSEIQTYFDRTALDAWKRFASDKPLSFVRAKVRAGRDEMRSTMLSYLPPDLSGWRILDAGCGSGAMAVELANRGADVIGIDLSPEIVRFGMENLPHITGGGTVELISGDMLDPMLGQFDAVMAMDSVIHYRHEDAVEALSALAERTTRKIVFTFAPRTPLLVTMRAVGKTFPRKDRAPFIVPVSPQLMTERLNTLDEWNVGRTRRVKRPFYISQAMELVRT